MNQRQQRDKGRRKRVPDREAPRGESTELWRERKLSVFGAGGK